MNARLYRGGTRIDAVTADDRGLAYGDGLFETLRVHRGAPVWWDAHWRRLARGAQVLGLPLPDESFVRGEAAGLLEDRAEGVLKLVLTRGRGGRGYAPPADAEPTLVLSHHDLPPPRPPLRLRWCRTPLALQTVLAGIKHLNRLEQVLARAEWSDPGIDEGLQCDTDGHVVAATAGNLFVRLRGRWLTPPVDRCGIAGVARGWILDRFPEIAESRLRPHDVLQADAALLCNSVRGIEPVARLDDRDFDPAPAAVLRAALAGAEPAFAAPG